MEKGKVYYCKIRLFGEFVQNRDKYTVPITILHIDVIIGNMQHLQAAIEDDMYYVPQSDAQELTLKKPCYIALPESI